MVLVASVLCAAYITHCANTGGLGWVSWVGCSTPASRGWVVVVCSGTGCVDRAEPQRAGGMSWWVLEMGYGEEAEPR